MIQTFVVEPENENMRLDKCITEEWPELSRTLVQKLIKEGKASVNGSFAKANYKVTAGDSVILCIPDPTELDVVPEDIPLKILYEDSDVIVVDKPKDMVIHPAAGHPTGTLVNALLYHCRDNLSGINGVLRPGIVHRIDKDTTGAIIACKNDMAHEAIAQQLKAHTIRRRYVAVCMGNLPNSEGTIHVPIGRHPTDRKNWPSILPTEKTRSRIIRYCSVTISTIISNAVWKQGGPIRFEFIWQVSAIRFWAIQSTIPTPIRNILNCTGRCCMRKRLDLSIRGQANIWNLNPNCPNILRIC